MSVQSEHTCKNCGYFRQHYIWLQRYESINFGHCVHPPKMRNCRPGMKACVKWIPQDEMYQAQHFPPQWAER